MAHLGGPALAFTIVDGINQGGVVPVLDDIVRSIMDLNFNGVPTIVYQEYDARLPTPDHCCHLLRSNLNRGRPKNINS